MDRSEHLLCTRPSAATASYKILQFISLQDRPVSPLEIAQFLKLNPSTTRARISELRKRGLLRREYHGAYTSDPTYGVGSLGGRRPPRVQNLRVSARGVPVSVSESVTHALEDLVIHVTFGLKRGIVSYTVKAPLGLDLYSLRLCHFIAEAECGARGYSGLDWRATNFEFLTDYGGLRLEGVQIATFDDLTGQLEKFYNLPGLRREVRASTGRSVSLTELEALVSGGVDRFQLVGAVSQILREVRDLGESQKWLNRKVQTALDAFMRARGGKTWGEGFVGEG